jgi:hypothetical protein
MQIDLFQFRLWDIDRERAFLEEYKRQHPNGFTCGLIKQAMSKIIQSKESQRVTK